MRSGFLTSAAAKGASLFKMMDQSRHRSVETLRGYIRDAEIFKEPAGGPAATPHPTACAIPAPDPTWHRPSSQPHNLTGRPLRLETPPTAEWRAPDQAQPQP